MYFLDIRTDDGYSDTTMVVKINACDDCLDVGFFGCATSMLRIHVPYTKLPQDLGTHSTTKILPVDGQVLRDAAT